MSELAQLPNCRARVDELERVLRDIRKTARDAVEGPAYVSTLEWIVEEIDVLLGDA